METIRLTETVKKGGCAAKLPAGTLKALLGDMALSRAPELAVGTETLDDACLWDVGDGSYLIQTLDFFTPIVDDARDFGAIAAANAISDVYAMGGTPKLALSILAFPAQTLPLELLRPLMEGALEKIHEAGASLAGGHTIDDETLKLGFCVSGFVRKGREWTNQGARAGDALILTKGLGTGTITSALKIREARDEWVSAAIQSMKQLNRAVDLLEGVRVHAATDITGFGLAGHAVQLAEASRVRIEFEMTAIPTIHGARESIAAENLNRAHFTNKEYLGDRVAFAHSISIEDQWLCFDAQTSGGLLLSVPEAECERALTALRERFACAARIGTVLPRESARPALFFA